MRLGFVVMGVLVAGACGGGDGDSGTQAEPLAHPGDFPITQAVPEAAGAIYFEVSGLASGASFTATLAGPLDPAPGQDFDLGVYRVFEPTPDNALCTSFAAGDDSCDFVAPDGPVFVEVLNLANLTDNFTLNIAAQ